MFVSAVLLQSFWIVNYFVQLSAIQNNEALKKKVHVGFVFAGGVRSFVLPEIHESIRHNLIHAFCPPSICIGDVFVRLSIDDNTHLGVGANALGKKIEGSEDDKRHALNAVQKLAHVAPGAKFIVRMVNIGSKEEANEMDMVTSSDFKQKIYRDLDPRRYSMYFNRAAAYDMLLKEETEGGKAYQWVVHARLDAGWGEPIRPFSMWSMAKVWSPDSWYADVADNFLLLPRNQSDIFFSLKLQYSPDKVMCIGGTNYDPSTMRDGALRARGYTSEQITQAQNEDCFRKFDHNVIQDFIVTHERKSGITWTSAATSEVYLKRKLKYYGISREARTLGFSALFMFVSRYPLEFLCFWIEPSYFIPWVKEWQVLEPRYEAALHCQDPVGVGCTLMRRDFIAQYETNRAPNCDLGAMSSKYPLSGAPRSTCLLDRKMTDWNFMPFRIRRRGNKCVTTFGPRQDKVNMSTCIEATLKEDTYVHDYDDTQLFAVYPLSPLPQRIVSYHFKQHDKCLTVLGGDAPSPSRGRRQGQQADKGQGQGPETMLRVGMRECRDKTMMSQFFVVQLVSPTKGSPPASPSSTEALGGGKATMAAAMSAQSGRSRLFYPISIPHGPNSTHAGIRKAVTSARGNLGTQQGHGQGRGQGQGQGQGQGHIGNEGGSLKVGVDEWSPMLPDAVYAVLEWVGPTGLTPRDKRQCVHLVEDKDKGKSGITQEQMSESFFLGPCYSNTASVSATASASAGVPLHTSGTGVGTPPAGPAQRLAVLVLERAKNKSPTV